MSECPAPLHSPPTCRALPRSCALPCALPPFSLEQEALDTSSTGYQAPLPESEVRPLHEEDEDHLAGEADGEGEEGGGHRRGRGGRGRWAAARLGEPPWMCVWMICWGLHGCVKCVLGMKRAPAWQAWRDAQLCLLCPHLPGWDSGMQGPGARARGTAAYKIMLDADARVSNNVARASRVAARRRRRI